MAVKLLALCRWFGGGKGARVACNSWSEHLWCSFLGSGLFTLFFFFIFYFFLIYLRFGPTTSYFAVAVFVFFLATTNT